MIAALLTTNLYSPVEGGNTPAEVLIVAAIVVAFVLVVVAAAAVGRPKGDPAPSEPEADARAGADPGAGHP